MANVAALIGLMAYFTQAVIFAHTTVSNLDEGAYLLKGYLFASEQYRPFEPGISTTKAPLSFLIPGYVQLLFGPGLRTGRYLAVFFGVMAVIGTWVAAQRIGGKWLAAGSVWVFALSPTIIKYYSGGATQSTIACLLAWSLVLVLGENRPIWQLIMSGLLTGIMIMVRQNMLPVLPALALYAFWQHGWKSLGLLLSGLLVLTMVHITYWPDILQLWYWVPLVTIPAQAVYSGGGTPVWSPNIWFDSRLLSTFQAVRFHFIPLVGGLVSIFLWTRLSAWKSRADFRIGLFLQVLFWGLFYMHAAAAIGQDYCVFCFSPYIAFFNVAGILLVAISIRNWNWRPPLVIQVLLIIFLLVIFAGVSFSAFESIGDWLLSLPAPRMRDFRILPGFVTWGEIISNKFHLDHNRSMRYASTVFGLVVGTLVMIAGYLIWFRLRRDLTVKFAAFFAALILALGLLFSPVLHASTKADCDVDVIAGNEQIGEHLRGIIPPGSLVYWDGGLSAAPLLYLPGVRIFPPQINGGYTFLSNGDREQLYKFGYWNEEMDAEWKATADFFIIEDWRYADWKSFLAPDQFDEFPRSSVGTSCLEGSILRVFRRK
ncbi:hypothetical protein ANAEL_00221 [Anaerolineales bacterium]|nr:hypothetical protein ANAEL_00221 [Anaerolineales bacterium]